MRRKKKSPISKTKRKFISVIVTIHRGVYGKPLEKIIERVKI